MKSYFKQMTYFLLFIIVVHLTTATVPENTVKHILNVKNNKERNQMIIQEINRLKLTAPNMPNRIPQELLFMQKQLTNAYNLAQMHPYPDLSHLKSSYRFREEDINRVRSEINREPNSDEQKVGIADASSNSVFSFDFLASNAISGHQYWCSKGDHNDDQIVTWEAKLYKKTRIHGINMIWAYAPGSFNIEYSIDGISFKPIVEWRNTVDGGNRKWWELLIPSLKNSYKSFPDRITFDSPVFAIKVRINMKGPNNFYYGLYKVEFFVRDWVLAIKALLPNTCKHECWTVNVKDPIPGTQVESAECISIIGHSENRELFILTIDATIIHYASGLCVTTAENKMLTLMNCSDAIDKNDGRHKFFFAENGYISSEYNPQDCIYIPDDILQQNWAYSAKIEASSTIGDGGHEAIRAIGTYFINIDGNSNTYWSSNPGNEFPTLTLTFDSWITSNTMIIKWKYIAMNFDVYVLSSEKGWRHIFKVVGNNKREQTIMLKKLSIKAIQIKMSKSLEKRFEMAIYGILDILINDGGSQLARKKCDDITENALKTFQFEEQNFKIVLAKTDYTKEMNQLSKTFLKMGLFKKKLILNWQYISASKQTSINLKKVINEASLSIDSVLERLRIFKSVDLGKKNNNFLKILKKNFFENYFEKKAIDVKKNIGTSEKNPALDCSQIREISKTKKSGFYYIKPNCSLNPFRVFCDFSIQSQGLSFFIFNNNQSPNTRIETLKIETVNDIRYHCATQGLFPIELRNKDTGKRIAQILSSFGWDLARPMVIPLGYDYNCDRGACKKFYNSMNKKDSMPIIPFLFKSISGQLKDSVDSKNSIGFGYDNNANPTFFNLKEVNVTALVCSTNDFDNYDDPSVVRLTCSDNLISSPKLDVRINDEIKVKCPSFCAQELNSVLIGTSTYTGSSSICRAAIHLGIINDFNGGTLKLKVSGVEKSFSGSYMNGIKSDSSSESFHKNFILEKFKEKCPIDYLKHLYDQPSFLELENGVLNQNVLSELDQLQNKYLLEQITLANAVNNVANTAANTVNNVANNAVNAAANVANTATNAVNNVANTATNAVSNVANSINNAANTVNKLANLAFNAASMGLNSSKGKIGENADSKMKQEKNIQ